MLQIGLIGLGVSARGLLRRIQDGLAGDVRVVAALVRRPERVDRSLASEMLVTADREEFLRQPMSLVVEMAGQDAVFEHAEAVLAGGKDLLLISIGALADDALHNRLIEAAKRSGRRIIAPSGAIGGLDAISSAALGGLDEVTITTRKPTRAWASGPEMDEQLANATEPVLLYEGPTREAVRRYPANVNVAAALSLAGIGFDRTRIRILADPSVERNTHEVVARGYFGEIRVTIMNVPTENPKTGRITALSVLKALRNLQAPLVVGG